MKREVNIRKDLYTNALLPGVRPLSKESCAHDEGIDGSFQGGCSTSEKFPCESSLSFEPKGEYDESGAFIVHSSVFF